MVALCWGGGAFRNEYAWKTQWSQGGGNGGKEFSLTGLGAQRITCPPGLTSLRFDLGEGGTQGSKDSIWNSAPDLGTASLILFS